MSILGEKSFLLALEIVKLAKQLRLIREFDFASQIFRAGTSIGANVQEALGGQSRRDFIAKISIAYKEARETKYWLRLLTETQTIEAKIVQPADIILTETIAMMVAILKTSKATTFNS
ncbi:four helix bundle protein [Candidatus Gracilibacteria bacterium]|nr:four helix bundle protein [Candidatus Gracilibacteria bacterium]